MAYEDIERLDRGTLKKAGYDPHWGPNVPMLHEPCGDAVWDPVKHDPLCRANGKGRTHPMLDGTQTPLSEPRSPLIN